MGRYWSVSADDRDWGECLLVEFRHRSGRPHPESNAWAMPQHTDENATLRTTPDFGCVQWQIKDSE